MLDFVLHPSSPDMRGIPVEDERLQNVTEWVSKQEDPIHGELLPDASQLSLEQLSPSTVRLPPPCLCRRGLGREEGRRRESSGPGGSGRNCFSALGKRRVEREPGTKPTSSRLCKTNLAYTAITRWMPRDDWWMCFGLPSNSKNKLQDLGAAHSCIQRCSRTGTGALLCSSWASTTRIAAAFWVRACCGLSVRRRSNGS
ncbi:unnamed protein product [Ectocarpus sp. 12 AP-2014]